MSDILKYGLVAAGAAYLYRDQIATLLGYGRPATLPPAPPATPPPAAAVVVTQALIQGAARDEALARTITTVRMTPDQWGYYAWPAGQGYDLNTPGRRDEQLTASEFWARRKAANV